MYEHVEEAKNSLLTPTPIPSLLLDVRGGNEGGAAPRKEGKDLFHTSTGQILGPWP
jgi:hypothetical protein